MIATALYLGLMAIAFSISGKNPLNENPIFAVFTAVILIADIWLVVTKVMRNVEGN